MSNLYKRILTSVPLFIITIYAIYNNIVIFCNICFNFKSYPIFQWNSIFMCSIINWNGFASKFNKCICNRLCSCTCPNDSTLFLTYIDIVFFKRKNKAFPICIIPLAFKNTIWWTYIFARIFKLINIIEYCLW